MSKIEDGWGDAAEKQLDPDSLSHFSSQTSVLPDSSLNSKLFFEECKRGGQDV